MKIFLIIIEIQHADLVKLVPNELNSLIFNNLKYGITNAGKIRNNVPKLCLYYLKKKV